MSSAKMAAILSREDELMDAKSPYGSSFTQQQIFLGKAFSYLTSAFWQSLSNF